jgi:hypothetical protein
MSPAPPINSTVGPLADLLGPDVELAPAYVLAHG